MITVRGRELIIPEIERQIGTPYDSCAETRQIKINRQTVGGIDISHLDFRLDLRYGNEVHPDTDILGKEVTEDSILLTWTVKAASVAQVGTVWIAVRGSDDFGTVKWATNEGALYVGRTINTPGDQDLPLTELELLEKRIDQKSEDLDAAENSRVEAEKIRVENENKRLQNEAEWQIQGEAAVEAAQTASEAAQIATTKAGEALGSAATATQSAQEATQASQGVQEAAQTASEAAQAASGAAQIAITKAGEASGSAATATQSAQEAAQAAQGVKEAAQTASEAAQTASEAAQTATTKAGEAAGSAATAEAAAERAEAAAGIDGTAGSVKATDVEGLVGEAGNQSDVQALLNEIAKRVVKEMVTSDTFQTQLARYLVNNALTTEIGKFALDAAFGKNIQDQIDQLNSNIENKIGTAGANTDAISWMKYAWINDHHALVVHFKDNKEKYLYFDV